MDTNVKKIYSKLNNKNYYVVFGLSNCSFCNKTKSFFNIKKINYKFYPVDDFKELFLKNLIDINTSYPELNIDKLHKTFPIIFYKNKFIGGYTDLIYSFDKK